MRVDMREHKAIRDQVHAGISALRVQGRQIWGDTRQTFPDIAMRLTWLARDVARLARDHTDTNEIKKDLGNILFSTIRWIDDLGFDALECLDLAIEAQEKFVGSGRPR